MSDDIASGDNFDRRSFLKKVALVGAFAAPVVTSFSMGGLSDLFGSPAGAQGANRGTGGPGSYGPYGVPEGHGGHSNTI